MNKKKTKAESTATSISRSRPSTVFPCSKNNRAPMAQGNKLSLNVGLRQQQQLKQQRKGPAKDNDTEDLPKTIFRARPVPNFKALHNRLPHQKPQDASLVGSTSVGNVARVSGSTKKVSNVDMKENSEKEANSSHWRLSNGTSCEPGPKASRLSRTSMEQPKIAKLAYELPTPLLKNVTRRRG